MSQESDWALNYIKKNEKLFGEPMIVIEELNKGGSYWILAMKPEKIYMIGMRLIKNKTTVQQMFYPLGNNEEEYWKILDYFKTKYDPMFHKILHDSVFFKYNV